LDTKRLILLGAACASLALALASSTGTALADSPQQVGDCASVTASASFRGDGYRHIVTLTNNCQRTVACEVWTDVDPTPHHLLQAKPGKSADVITRNGSPASGVRAEKLCHFTL
jgi:hypothetical protein